jgi:hypothetical protein
MKCHPVRHNDNELHTPFPEVTYIQVCVIVRSQHRWVSCVWRGVRDLSQGTLLHLWLNSFDFWINCPINPADSLGTLWKQHIYIRYTLLILFHGIRLPSRFFFFNKSGRIKITADTWLAVLWGYFSFGLITADVENFGKTLLSKTTKFYTQRNLSIYRI